MAAEDVNIDLSNYKDRMGQRVLPGRYPVIVEDAETDTARSGNTMINVWLRVLGGEFDGATIMDRLVLTEKSLFRVVGFMQAIGLPTPKKRIRVNLRQFIGKTLEVDVEDGDPFNGRVKSEVRGYLRISKQAQAEVTDIEDISEESSDDPMAVFTEGEEPENGNGPTAESREKVPDEVDLDKIDLG